ncbi:hypothetical protein DIE18_36455 [Burkholderia sp. Bp9125]|nr:hypothetical protein DIE18_36455 [Burkholderia sp. Bp9125]
MALLCFPAAAAMMALAGCGGGDDPVATGSSAAAKAVGKDAASLSPTTVEITAGTSQQVTAFFDQRSGCVETSLFVAGISGDVSSSVNGGPPVRSSSSKIFLSVSVFDWCQYVFLVSAYGNAPANSLEVAQDLTGARLTGVATMNDTVRSTILNMQVDVTWTGTGDKFHVHSAEHVSTFPGGFVNTHVTGWVRQAIASGTVTDGTTNYTPAAALFSSMNEIDSGKVEIATAAAAPIAGATP